MSTNEASANEASISNTFSFSLSHRYQKQPNGSIVNLSGSGGNELGHRLLNHYSGGRTFGLQTATRNATKIFMEDFLKQKLKKNGGERAKRSEASLAKRALKKTRAMKCAKWLQTATSTTKLTPEFVWRRADETGISLNPLMAAQINSLCVDCNVGKLYPLLNMPMKKLVPREKIGFFATGGRKPEEIVEEITHSLTQQAITDANMAANKVEGVATVGDKAVTVKLAPLPIDKDQLWEDIQKELERLGAGSFMLENEMDAEESFEATKSVRNALNDVLSTEQFANKQMLGYCGVPFDPKNSQSLEHQEFFKMLKTKDLVETDTIQYDLEKSSDRTEFNRIWKIACILERKNKTERGEATIINFKTPDMLLKGKS